MGFIHPITTFVTSKSYLEMSSRIWANTHICRFWRFRGFPLPWVSRGNQRKISPIVSIFFTRCVSNHLY